MQYTHSYSGPVHTHKQNKYTHIWIWVYIIYNYIYTAHIQICNFYNSYNIVNTINIYTYIYIITNTNTRHVLTYWFLDHHHLHRSLLHSSMFGNFALLSLPLATRIIEQFIVFRIVQDLPMHLACLWKLEKTAIVVGWHMISAQKPFVVLQLLVSEGFPQHPKADNETN